MDKGNNNCIEHPFVFVIDIWGSQFKHLRQKYHILAGVTIMPITSTDTVRYANKEFIE